MIRPSRFFALALLSILSIAVALLASEAVLRLLDYHYSPMQIMRVEARAASGDQRYYHSFRDEHFVFDPYLIWRPKPGADVFNAQGYRGQEMPAIKAPGSYRIFTVGDSNTLGWGTEKGANWPAYLEHLLVESNGRFAVINAGVWGYASFQGVRRFNEALVWQPDMVIVSFGSNDAHPVLVSDANFAARMTLGRLIGWSRVGELLIAAVDRLKGKRDVPTVPRVSLDEYRENLRTIIELARTRHIVVVLLTRPFIGDAPFGSWKVKAPAYVRATLEVGRENGVTCVDIYSYFSDKPQYFTDESHFTNEGHELAAQMIYDQIKPLIH